MNVNATWFLISKTERWGQIPHLVCSQVIDGGNTCYRVERTRTSELTFRERAVD